MVSFRELDSDLILLDFWGTWCVPCRKSIPHLNELQKTLGGKKLQVIGIACERVPAKDRAAKVAAAVKDLKIAYPVLTTAMDGTCPVQEAFQIQFYPTMILLDRQGRILEARGGRDRRDPRPDGPIHRQEPEPARAVRRRQPHERLLRGDERWAIAAMRSQSPPRRDAATVACIRTGP